MAGRGRAPKAPDQRRNRHAPQRGEWVDLPPLSKPALPTLPKDEWSPRTKRAWEAWRKDPATGKYGPAEVQSAIDLAYVYEQWVRDGTATLASEVRKRQDDLGLTLKGKQERRWRVAEPEDEPHLAPLAVVKPLPIKDPRGAA